MSKAIMLKLKEEYLNTVIKLKERIIELNKQNKELPYKEQISMKKRIICLYTEVRELIQTATNINNYCNSCNMGAC